MTTTTGIAPNRQPRYHSAICYTDRPSKARYIAEKYRAIFAGSVLDVGCDAAPLRSLVAQPTKYVGVDFNPGADVVLDLDHDDLPFAARSFDTVVCTDVLEHLERAHAVFDELCRVSASRVIVSLPNPLAALVESIAHGKDGRIKYYGLPSERPADRHRWFFGGDEAEQFVRSRAARNGFFIEQLDFEAGPDVAWLFRGAEGAARVTSTNFTRGTMWAVLRRGEEA